jgi:transposase
MHFVPVKTVARQAHGIILKVRETLVSQRTALINAVHGHATEFGIVAAKGAKKIADLFSSIEQDESLPAEVTQMFALLRGQLDEIDNRIAKIEALLNAAHKANEVSQRRAASVARSIA